MRSWSSTPLDELDAVLPHEVLRNATRAGASWDVAMVGVRHPGDLVGAHGLRIRVDEALGTPDAVLVPGGGWAGRADAGAWQQARDGYLPDR